MSEYDPAEIERLVREAREDDERMTEVPWEAQIFERCTGEPLHRWRIFLRGAQNPRTNSRDCDWTEADASGIARTRNNLTAMADQLEAAQREVERLTTERDNARWADKTRRKVCEALSAERDRLRAEVERLNGQVGHLAADGDYLDAERDRLRAELADILAERELARITISMMETLAVQQLEVIDKLRAEVERLSAREGALMDRIYSKSELVEIGWSCNGEHDDGIAAGNLTACSDRSGCGRRGCPYRATRDKAGDR